MVRPTSIPSIPGGRKEGRRPHSEGGRAGRRSEARGGWEVWSEDQTGCQFRSSKSDVFVCVCVSAFVRVSAVMRKLESVRIFRLMLVPSPLKFLFQDLTFRLCFSVGQGGCPSGPSDVNK